MPNKVTHLWEYTCDFCCKHEATFDVATGTGNKELGELLVGEDGPGLIIDVGMAVDGKLLEWRFWDGGKRGCACRELLLTESEFDELVAHAPKGGWDFEGNADLVLAVKGPGMLK